MAVPKRRPIPPTSMKFMFRQMVKKYALLMLTIKYIRLLKAKMVVSLKIQMKYLLMMGQLL